MAVAPLGGLASCWLAACGLAVGLGFGASDASDGVEEELEPRRRGILEGESRASVLAAFSAFRPPDSPELMNLLPVAVGLGAASRFRRGAAFGPFTFNNNATQFLFELESLVRYQIPQQ